jgi:putative FmdB family regulatory protein
VKCVFELNETAKVFSNMPIYEYQCQACRHEFETIQKFSDAPLTRCPECGKHKLKKKISAVAFRLKGGGWYETDFKSGDKKNVASSSDAGDSSDSSSKSESTSSSDAKAKDDKATAKSTSDGASKSSNGETKSSAKKSTTKGPSKGSPSTGKSKRDTKDGGKKR